MNHNYCIMNLFKYIILLQSNSSNVYCLKNNNFNGSRSIIFYNTRVISFYKKDGSLFTVSYTNDSNNISSSSIFRIMNIHDSCVSLLILNKDDDSYYSTNQHITIDISTIGAIRCIVDTDI